MGTYSPLFCPYSILPILIFSSLIPIFPSRPHSILIFLILFSISSSLIHIFPFLIFPSLILIFSFFILTLIFLCPLFIQKHSLDHHDFSWLGFQLTTNFWLPTDYRLTFLFYWGSLGSHKGSLRVHCRFTRVHWGSHGGVHWGLHEGALRFTWGFTEGSLGVTWGHTRIYENKGEDG